MTRVEYRVSGTRKRDGIRWGHTDDHWRPHVPRRQEIEQLMKSGINDNVRVERRTVTISEPEEVPLDRLH